MKKRTKKSADMGAHFEIEKGYRINKAEYQSLKEILPKMGFAFQKRSHITDFVVPSKGRTTRRLRIENIKESADGKIDVKYIKCFKNHPIKGKIGRYARFEDEIVVSAQDAMEYILGVMQRLHAPIPFYTKKRWHYQGEYEGIALTITPDRARHLGRFSGHYVEIEALLPLGSTDQQVAEIQAIIDKLAAELIGKRKAKISYRKMLKKVWSKWVSKKKLNRSPRRKLKKARVNYRKLLNKVGKPARTRPAAEQQ